MEKLIRELLDAGISPEDMASMATKIKNETEAKEKALKKAETALLEAMANYLEAQGVPYEVIEKTDWKLVSKQMNKMMQMFLPIFNSDKTNTHEPIKVIISEATESNGDDVFETLTKILDEMIEGV